MTGDDKLMKDLIARMERLEQLLLPTRNRSVAKHPSGDKTYRGATSGIRLLVDSGYLDKKRTFSEICKALEEKGYNYSKQAVQTPLNNLSSVKAGLLVGLKERGKKVYAKRK